MLTFSSASVSAKRRHMASSVGVRGARPPFAKEGSGSGSDVRSTFPLAVSGILSNGITTDGTIYSGRWRAAYARSSSASGRGAPVT
jgi:hypothetical protein